MNEKKSGIIIYSQSLQNDEQDDLWYNGKYYKGASNLSWATVAKQLQGSSLTEKDGIKYHIGCKGVYFIVPSQERDKEGRISLITIFCPKKPF